MPERYYRQAEIAYLLRLELANEGITQRQWAKRNKIPEQIVSDFLNGRRAPNDDILKALDFDPVPVWRTKMARTRKPTPVPAHIKPEAVSNRKQLADLRQAKNKEKK